MANCAAAAPAPLKHLPVLDAPRAWIALFIAATDAGTRASLFHVCKQLRGMVRGTCSRVRLQQKWTRDPADTAATRQLRQLAGCRRGADVQLVISAQPALVPGQFESWERTVEAAAWLDNLCARVALGLEPTVPLHCVTYLELEGVLTTELVPPSVAAACPNLRRIKHCNYKPWKAYGLADPTPRQHPRLTCLTVVCRLPSDDMKSKPLTAAADTASGKLLMKQLQTLPKLTSVSLEGYYRVGAYWKHALSGVQQQLTSLTIQTTTKYTPLFDTAWPQLQCLYLLYWTPKPGELQQLSTNLPSVSVIGICNEHRQCWSPRKCLMMAPLGLRHVLTNHVSISDLAMATSCGLASFQFTCLHVTGNDLKCIPEAIANIGSCKQVGTWPEVSLTVCVHDIPPGREVLPSLLPLLKVLSYTHLRLEGSLLLEDSSTALFMQLPQAHALQFHSITIRSDAERVCMLDNATVLCAQARWHAALIVTKEFQTAMGNGWQQLLNEAMQAAGHQYITFRIVYHL